MLPKAAPIQRKLMTIILLTSGIVVLLTCALFVAYELLQYRQDMRERAEVLGRIIADNSTAALVFNNQQEARTILSSIDADRHFVNAALYDASGKLFVFYPDTLSAALLPASPGVAGYKFESGYLSGFQPVMQAGNQAGTLFLRADLSSMWSSLLVYVSVAGIVLLSALIVAVLLSREFQRRISTPVLSLAQTARVVSDRRDYSVRAERSGIDEFGLLTDAFNHMLGQIQEQDRSLRESEERFSAMFRATPVAIALASADDGRLFDVNQAWLRQTGFSRKEEVIGKNSIELGLVDDSSRRAEILEEFRRNSFVRDAETTFRNTSGERRALQVSLQRVTLGGKVFILSAHVDITHRKQMEVALRESEERFRAAQEGSLDGFAILKAERDNAGRIIDFTWTYVNQSEERIAGVEPGGLLGKRLLEVYPSYRAQGTFDSFVRVARTGEAFVEEVRLVRGGSDIYIRLTATRVSDGLAVTSLDLTERKRAEEAVILANQRVQNAISALNAGYWDARITVQDGASQPLVFSDVFLDTRLRQLLGYESFESKFPNSFEAIRQHVIPEDWSRIMRSLAEYYAGERDLFSETFRIRRRDGRTIWVQARGILFHDEPQQPVRFTGVIWDITEQRQWEERLRELNASLEDRVRERTAELGLSNEQLRKEVDTRQRAETKLRAATEALEVERDALKHSYDTMNAIRNSIEDQKLRSNQVLASAIDQVIIRGLERLKGNIQPPQDHIIESIEQDLDDILSPFLRSNRMAASPLASLTPRELEACKLLRNGASADDLAERMQVSRKSALRYVDTIRSKLNIPNGSTDLQSFLQTLKEI